MFYNKTYALILQSQGFIKEALEIYKKLPQEEVKEEIENLTKKKHFKDVNVLKLKEFNEIDEKNRFEFEKWLSEI